MEPATESLPPQQKPIDLEKEKKGVPLPLPTWAIFVIGFFNAAIEANNGKTTEFHPLPHPLPEEKDEKRKQPPKSEVEKLTDKRVPARTRLFNLAFPGVRATPLPVRIPIPARR